LSDDPHYTIEEAEQLAIDTLVQELTGDRAQDRIMAASRIQEIRRKGTINNNLNINLLDDKYLEGVLNGIKEIASSKSTGGSE
jgi:hypothetical protein